MKFSLNRNQCCEANRPLLGKKNAKMFEVSPFSLYFKNLFAFSSGETKANCSKLVSRQFVSADELELLKQSQHDLKRFQTSEWWCCS